MVRKEGDVLTVNVLMTETVPSPLFTTYTYAPLGVIATPSGLLPTATDDITVFVAVFITETVFPS
jgi:hypothetical protein